MRELPRCVTDALVTAASTRADVPTQGAESTVADVDRWVRWGGHDHVVALAGHADRHRVGPLLARFLGAGVGSPATQGGDPAMDLRRKLEMQRRAALESHLRGLHAARVVAASLHGLPWVLVKGPVLAAVYGRPDLRRYGDLDIVVSPEAFPSAVARLEADGFVLLDRDFALAHRLGLGQVHLLSPSGFVVDLHHDLVHRRSRRRLMRLPVDVVLDGRRPMPGLDGVARPAATSAVLHLCVHTAYSGADRLGWFADVHHTVVADDFDWSGLVATARSTGTAPACLLVLETCARTLGTPVPEVVLREFARGVAGRTMRLAVRGTTRSDPVPARRDDRWSSGRVLARSVAGSSARSLVRLPMTLVSAAARRVVGRGSPVSVLGDGPLDDAAERAFVAAVARGTYRAPAPRDAVPMTPRVEERT